MPIVSFLPDEILLSEVKKLLDTARDAAKKASNSKERNVVDPFALLFEMAGFGLSCRDWMEREEVRQAQKSLANAIGKFHQSILGGVKGWKDLGTGKEIDLVNFDRKIIAEIKNKHNTVNGTSLPSLHKKMGDLVTKKSSLFNGYTAYYVQIIPASPKRFDTLFEPSDNSTGSKVQASELVRKIDGASFYDLVTQKENSLHQLYLSLPTAISLVSSSVEFDDKSLELLMDYFFKAYGSRT
jgi:hypothetical protein